MLTTFLGNGNGIEVRAPGGSIRLDPKHETEPAVVTHAHTDHVPRRPRGAEPAGPAFMTRATRDLVRIRRPDLAAATLAYGDPLEVHGATVTLRDAGHVLGSAMVRVDTPHTSFLYTGDFSPTAGVTTRGARPERVDVLITETTYGDPRFDLPPRDLVLANLEAWVLRHLWSGSVALGSYELGRAQELVAWLNRCGVTPVVTTDIARISAVYNDHGQDLSYAVLGSGKAQEMAGNCCYVVPKAYLRKDHDFVRRLKAEDGVGAYLSGWCHVYDYFKNYWIDAQFPLTDHATFPELLAFVEAVAPNEVVTVHGRAAVFAKEVTRRTGILARALDDG